METQTMVKNSQVKTRQNENTTQKVFTRRFYRSFSGFETLQNSSSQKMGQASTNAADKTVVEKRKEKENEPTLSKKFDDEPKAFLKDESGLNSKDEPAENPMKLNLVSKQDLSRSNSNGDFQEMAASQVVNRSPKEESTENLYFEPVQLKDLIENEKFAKLLEIAKSQDIFKLEELERLKKGDVIGDFTKAAKLDKVEKPDKIKVNLMGDEKNKNLDPYEASAKNKNTITDNLTKTVNSRNNESLFGLNKQGEKAGVFAKTTAGTVQSELKIETVDLSNNRATEIFGNSTTIKKEGNSTEILNRESSQSDAIQLHDENILQEIDKLVDEKQNSNLDNEVPAIENTSDLAIETKQATQAEEGNDQLSLSEQIDNENFDEDNLDGGKRYSAAQDFGKLSTIFRDRRSQYQAYIFFLIVASVSAVTLSYKFSVAGLGSISQFVTNYFAYAKTLGNGFWDTAVFSSPFLLTSLLVYFGGYTVFAKVLSALWMLASGFVWGLFASISYSVLDTTQMIFFSVISAVLLFTCVLFAAEAGKYSALNVYGKAELMKSSNVRQFTFVYIVYCIAVMLLSVVMLRYIF